MSRYDDPSPLALAVLKIIYPHSSLRPIAMGDIHKASRTMAPPDEIHDALEALIDARLISTMRHTVGGVTQNVYWPTGLQPITAPTIEEIRMASEPKNSQLARMILQHGPISGTDLAAKATAAGLNCPTKNVQGILGGHLSRGEIVVKKRDGANWYMTKTQAADWVENLRIGAEWEAKNNQEAGSEQAAHVMSAPASTKQSEGEIPVNESDEGNEEPCHNCPANPEPEEGLTCAREEIAELKTRVHDLLNDAAGAHLVLQDLAKKLSVEKFEDIPGAFDELTQALAARAMHQEPASGRMALVLIDSAELTEIEPISADDDAQAMAMSNIELGHAARVLVVRIMGEARRQVEWKEAA